ncbi:MAG: hypothetical protein HUU16_09345 [Candidatus Omnitrophica bacterium]|nr:hypothetical protein [Candidatus Omnitrophota bacterium]
MKTLLLPTLILLLIPRISHAESWDCEVFPTEREVVTDPTSGAKLTLITGNTAEDLNLYFHQRSWLADGSLLIFRTQRGGASEIFGYLEATGELVRLQRPGQAIAGDPCAGRRDSRIYVIHDQAAYSWKPEIKIGSGDKPSTVRIEETLIGKLPERAASSLGLNDNSDGTALVSGFTLRGSNGSEIVLMNKADGAVKTLAAFEVVVTHLQASWEDPDLVLFAHGGRVSDRAKDVQAGEVAARMYLVDSSGKAPWPIYPQLDGELVTHECWWTENRVLFCSGINRDGHEEEAHVKEIDLDTGIARIIGAGCWWPTGTPAEVSKYNWWHCAGSPCGRFAAADNWHGDIGIFSGKTARARILTQNHRTYGHGAHPHVGWNNEGSKVVFTSTRRGNPDVCVAELPESWLREGW